MTAYLVAFVALLGTLVGMPFGNAGFNPGPPTIYQVEPAPLTGQNALVLAIDTSVEDAVLARVQQSAATLVDGLADTPVALVTIGEAPATIQDFTTDTTLVTTALDALQTTTGTALFDGSLEAIDLAASAAADNAIVVLFTDGAEAGDVSQASSADVLRQALLNSVKVYAIGYGDALDTTFLDIVSGSNGATFQQISAAADIDNAFADLAPIFGATQTTTVTTPQEAGSGVLPGAVGEVAGNAAAEETETAPSAIAPLPAETADQTATDANIAPIGRVTSNDSVVLVVDMSGSMATYLTALTTTLTNFVQEVRGAAPIAIVGFDTEAYLVSDFSTDVDALVSAVESLELGDAAALYDAMLQAAEIAADSPAESTSIIVLTDSADSAPSSAGRQEAIDRAVEAGVSVYAFGLGSPDATYLREFANETGGTYELIGASMLEGRYDALRQTLIGDVTIVDNPLSDITLGDGGAIAAPSEIVPLDAADTGISLAEAVGQGGQATSDNNSDLVNPAALGLEQADADAAEADAAAIGAISPEQLEQGSVEPVTGLIPVIIRIPEDFELSGAILSVNDVPLFAFDGVTADSTLEYNQFDTSLLDTGSYKMGLQVTNADGVSFSDDLFFNVQVLQTDGSGIEVGEDGEDIIDPSTLSVTDSVAPRLITIGGEVRPFLLQFAPDEGLSLDTDALATQATGGEGQSLLDILLGPLDFIPEPIKNALTRQYPGATTAIVVLMTVILLPQGIFTVYWMTYTWVSPERVERSRSPREYYEPKYSITAMLPARKEGAVIYDTIQSVHGVDYPDELKHIQVLVRNDFPHDADAELNNAPLTDAEKEVKDAEARAKTAGIIAEEQERFARNNQPWPDIQEVLQQPGAELKDDHITLIETLRAIYDIRDLYQTRFALMEIKAAYEADGKAFPETVILTDFKPGAEPKVFWKATEGDEVEAEIEVRGIFQQDPVDGRSYQKLIWKTKGDAQIFEQIKGEVAERKKGYKPFDQRIWVENVELIHFEGGPKNKPNGLNRGLRAAHTDVMTIFDAEDSPHPDIYNIVNTVMIRDKADVVQSGVQLMNFETTWFSSFNCLEYFFWFKSGLHAYTHALKVTPLGGNTCFFKKVWLDKLAAQDEEKGYRAWDEGCLTEDADVGFRLTSMGASIQIVYDAKHATQEETPDGVPEFVKQRTRWCQGFYEIFMKFDWARLPTFKQRVVALYILLNSLLQAAVLLFLPIGIYIGLTQQVSLAVALLSWLPIYLLLVQAGITLLGIREFTASYGMKLPLGFRLRMAFFYYPYQLLMAASALRAVYRFLTNNSAWEKTAHSNLHRAGGAQQAQVHG